MLDDRAVIHIIVIGDDQRRIELGRERFRPGQALASRERRDAREAPAGFLGHERVVELGLGAARLDKLDQS